MNGIQITLRNLSRSTALSQRIRKMNDHLQVLHPGILGTRVTVEGPGPRERHGGDFTVGVSLQVPGREIVATHSHAQDVYAALSGAFIAARRQLLDASKPKRFARDPLQHSQGETNEE
ncbi:MAG: HPF/RaiA family ribosome-associated protein [Usitatibacter sp.]